MADPYGGGDGGRAVKQQAPQQRQARLKPALEMEDLISLLHGSDPVRVELTRLENDLHYKEKELGDAQAEIRALRLSERAREKAVEDLTEELAKVDGKLKLRVSPRKQKPGSEEDQRREESGDGCAVRGGGDAAEGPRRAEGRRHAFHRGHPRTAGGRAEASPSGAGNEFQGVDMLVADHAACRVARVI